jgi:hypothetical protein
MEWNAVLANYIGNLSKLGNWKLRRGLQRAGLATPREGDCYDRQFSFSFSFSLRTIFSTRTQLCCVLFPFQNTVTSVQHCYAYPEHSRVSFLFIYGYTDSIVQLSAVTQVLYEYDSLTQFTRQYD